MDFFLKGLFWLHPKWVCDWTAV